jgi:signal transduction histidine kinase
MKREFMNIAVHELRGPLTVIEGYTELLMRDRAAALDADDERQLATIRRQAEHARTLAEDLLILARIESHDLGVAGDILTAGELVTASIDRLLPRARLRSGTISVQGSEEAQMLGDRALVSRVIDNLIGNAIVYSVDRPDITVTIAADSGWVNIRVQDSGPGIHDDEHERIFGRFVRGAGAGAIHGSGLGLYLSRECARRMGGDLVLEATGPAIGSRFRLSLPAA